jgi:hypothetical protein
MGSIPVGTTRLIYRDIRDENHLFFWKKPNIAVDIAVNLIGLGN